MELKPLSETLVKRIQEHLVDNLGSDGGAWIGGTDYESLELLDEVLEEATGRGV